MKDTMKLPDELPLGKQVAAADGYDKNLLVAIPRKLTRDVLGINNDQLPFYGEDIWQAFELSWLNQRGKPVVAVGRFSIPCDSWAIVESKSLKLYLNALNQTHFESVAALSACIQQDLSDLLQTDVNLDIQVLNASLPKSFQPAVIKGSCLDGLDIQVNDYQVNPGLLSLDESRGEVRETLYTHLLRSLCPVTSQPDWGSVVIDYTGMAIDHKSLLAYLISYRQHQEFHEQCIERIFMDLLRFIACKELTVQGFYLRRGGLDINPVRSTLPQAVKTLRLLRQ